MNKKDVIEYYKSVYGREPSEGEIQSELSKASQNMSDAPVSDDQVDAEAMNAEIERLKKKLEKERQAKDSVNVLARLVPSRRHLIKVLEFMKNNAITLFIAFLIALIFPTVRWWIFLVYLIVNYFYALLSTNRRFLWDRKLDGWLHDSDNLKKIYRATVASVENVKDSFSTDENESQDDPTILKQEPIDQGYTESEPTQMYPETAQATEIESPSSFEVQKHGGLFNIIFYVLGLIPVYVLITYAAQFGLIAGTTVGTLVVIDFLLTLIYFLPTLIYHASFGGKLLMWFANMLLGWTLLVWIILLAIAIHQNHESAFKQELLYNQHKQQ